MARIAIGGFQHENQHLRAQADYAAFEAGGGWPGVQYGEPIFGAVEGANIGGRCNRGVARAWPQPGRHRLGRCEPVGARDGGAFRKDYD